MQVKWAGAPHKKIDVHPVTSELALMPRTSFLTWTEEVRGCSREWSELEVETAHSLFVNLMELMRLIRMRVRMVEQTIARQKIGKSFYIFISLYISSFSYTSCPSFANIFSPSFFRSAEREKVMAEESNKMKTQFIANLSHEVRYINMQPYIL